MSLQRNYYEVLGIPPGATTDQIKKKYRELARKFHPDVVQDKVLGQRVFSQINQAYRVLGDPERRAQYNTILTAAKAPVPVPAAPFPAPGGVQTRTMPPGAGATGMAQKAQAVSGLLANADNAVMAGRPIEARAFCIKVLEIDPYNVKALEMLGDALALMGQREEAAVQYRNALKTAPSSMLQAKLNRMEGAGVSTRTNLPQEEPEKQGGGVFGRFLGRK